MAGEVTRDWRPGFPVDARATLSSLRRGSGDPCLRFDPSGIWWATGTPVGDGLLHLRPRPAEGMIAARAWGEGGSWLLDGVPELLGAADDVSGFVPRPEHRMLTTAWRSRPGWRVPRSRRVFDALAAACLEQVVTGVEARSAWRRLVTAYGLPAPGPAGASVGPAAGMRVPPTPQAWRSVPSGVWLRAGVGEHRRAALLAGARVAESLERTLAMESERVEAALRSLPGVGVWTAAETRQRAHGDADAFSFADYHVAKNITWALTGKVMDDAACEALLEPYRPHRYRVQRLLELAGAARPRRAPRMTLPSHLPGRSTSRFNEGRRG